MAYLDAELNAQADDVVGRAATVVVHVGDPGADGLSNVDATVAASFNAGGVEGPDGASTQPATPGVAWGKPSLTVTGATLTHWSLRDSGGTCMGYWPIEPNAEVPAGTYSPNINVGPGV